MTVTIPTLMLNTHTCQKNIATMVQKAQTAGVELRPHFKTHQSHIIGRWFREKGIEKITVSSLTMASYFAQDDWKDITVAFPVNIREISTINELAAQITLNLVIESLESLQFLAEKATAPLQIWLKIDTGYHRTGIAFDNLPLIQQVIEQAKSYPSLHLQGFLAHAGHSYQARSRSEIIATHQSSMSNLRQLQQHYPHLQYSVGDTPTCSIADHFEPATEIRPGNFVFYDLTQRAIGSCNTEQIAVALACPIVAIHPSREEVIIYGGGVHFSKDFLIEANGLKHYGKLIDLKGQQWGTIQEDIYVKKLSQEHGTLHVPSSKIHSFKVGQIAHLLPIHSCMTANLLKRYMTLEGAEIRMMQN